MRVASRSIAGAIAALGVALAGAIVAAPAAWAATVPLTFLNINDFHGRIDANTVKFAGTVEQERAAAGEANTVLLSAGDNIGASLFASSSQQDQPTIDVLNALDLGASAVGNHEFDQGYADLTNRVIGDPANAEFPYLGANVYFAGTQDPALDEYALLDVSGVTVGVVGAVTQETSALVSPAGIANLSFGDPVAAVNRVAGELTDGDAANGEADIVVAEYHEGAPTSGDLGGLVVPGSVFAHIVEDTTPAVDIIFTGHTHQVYAGTVNGRPVVQTGSYGERIGKVSLTYDTQTDTVSGVTAANVPRTTTADADLVATYPRVAAVKSIVDSALAQAAVIGNQPVGSVAADITTAYTGGSYVDGVYTVADPAVGRDDRASESTLGDLVANALRDKLSAPEWGGAQIGVVNPGGLRAELLYAQSDVGEGDGVVTFAEANAILPFVNNLWTTTLTGAQFTLLLEQQWQRDINGNVPSRAYLQLGLSDNVSYTFDPALPEGSRITSVTVDGAPLDPDAEYRIGTFSFLTSGGDNFRAFTLGSDAKDTGLIDRDAWIEYISEHPGLTPSFARRAVQVSGLAISVPAGSSASVPVAGLDLTSLGSPLNTTLDVALDGVPLGTVPVAGGAATAVAIVPVSTTLGAHVLTLVAQPSGTTVTVPVTVTAPLVATHTTLKAAPKVSKLGTAGPVLLTAKVTATRGAAVSGTVEFVVDGEVVGTGDLAGGTASLTLPAATESGTRIAVARFLGTDTLAASQSPDVKVKTK